MDTFSQYAQIKDIRLIKDKSNGDQYKDFGFIEFFTVEDAAYVLEKAKQDRIKIKGIPVFLSYSRYKKTEQYVNYISYVYIFSSRAILINHRDLRIKGQLRIYNNSIQATKTFIQEV